MLQHCMPMIKKKPARFLQGAARIFALGRLKPCGSQPHDLTEVPRSSTIGLSATLRNSLSAHRGNYGLARQSPASTDSNVPPL